MEDKISCPLINGELDVGDCVVYSDVASGMLKENCIPDVLRAKENWREICQKCKYHSM